MCSLTLHVHSNKNRRVIPIYRQAFSTSQIFNNCEMMRFNALSGFIFALLFFVSTASPVFPTAQENSSIKQFSSGSSSSSASSSTGTEGLDETCSSNWMSKAGKVLKPEGWKISMRPTLRARILGRTTSAYDSMFEDLQKCVTFPVLTIDQRASIYEQLACHGKWGISPALGGRTWDFEAWRPSIGINAALGGLLPPSHRCNWT